MIRVGDYVRLNSGGPIMLVKSVDIVGSAHCIYPDPDGEFTVKWFSSPVVCLTKI